MAQRDTSIASAEKEKKIYLLKTALNYQSYLRNMRTEQGDGPEKLAGVPAMVRVNCKYRPQIDNHIRHLIRDGFFVVKRGDGILRKGQKRSQKRNTYLVLTEKGFAEAKRLAKQIPELMAAQGRHDVLEEGSFNGQIMAAEAVSGDFFP